MTHLNLLPTIIDLKANILVTNNFDGQWSIKIWPRAPLFLDSLLFNPTVKGAGSRISPWITNDVSGAFKYLNRLSDLCRKIALHNQSLLHIQTFMPILGRVNWKLLILISILLVLHKCNKSIWSQQLFLTVKNWLIFKTESSSLGSINKLNLKVF